MIERAGIDSPLGPLTLVAQDGAIIAMDWRSGPKPPRGLLKTATDQLCAYFDESLTEFTVPMAPHGSAFQLDFYQRLRAIPFGATRTYGEIAADMNVSAQAIGQACGANPLPILIPCHRVLGATSLGGYSGAGGVEAKVALLRLEGAAGLLI